jgi:hypothetical protein
VRLEQIIVSFTAIIEFWVTKLRRPRSVSNAYEEVRVVRVLAMFVLVFPQYIDVGKVVTPRQTSPNPKMSPNLHSYSKDLNISFNIFSVPT